MAKPRDILDELEMTYGIDHVAIRPVRGLAPLANPVANGSATLTTSASATGDQDTDGVLSGVKWAATSLTYSFPTAASQYGTYNTGNNEKSTFASVNAAMKLADVAAINMYDSVSDLALTQNTLTPGAATIRFAMSGAANPTAYAYYPDNDFCWRRCLVWEAERFQCHDQSDQRQLRLDVGHS